MIVLVLPSYLPLLSLTEKASPQLVTELMGRPATATAVSSSPPAAIILARTARKLSAVGSQQTDRSMSMPGKREGSR